MSDNGVLSFDDTKIALAHRSDKELRKSYQLFRAFNQPALLKIGTGLTNLAFKLHLPVTGLIKKTVFQQFCGGENLQECNAAIQDLARFNIKTVLEYSIEARSSEAEYENVLREIIKAIESAEQNRMIRIVSCKITGFARMELLEKIHSGKALSTSEAAEYEKVKLRMEKICSAAEKTGVGIFFDAEESWIQRPLDEMVDTLMEKYNRQKVIVYNTYQLYLKDRLAFLKAACQKAKERGFILGAKLVRGAYVEKEREHARENRYPSPVQATKPETDQAYNEAVKFCIENIEFISLCVASHNEESCSFLAKLMMEKGLPKNHPHVFLCQLYGMGDHITYQLATMGFETAKLIPYGPVREAIPYLIRRAEENSSVAGHAGRELVLLKKEMKRRNI